MLRRGTLAIVTTTSNRIADGAADAIEKARPVLATWARAGLVVRGLLYIMLGGLSALAAWYGTRTVGQGGTYATIHRQPFGIVLLIVIVVAFVGLGAWEIVQAVEAPQRWRRGTGVSDRKKWTWRTSALFRGLGYWAAAVGALEVLLLRRADPTGDHQARGWTAWLMSHPAGRWVVAIVGLGIGIFGLVQLARAAIGKLSPHLALSKLAPSQPAHGWLLVLARVGIAARGAVFLVVGLFLILAAWHENAHEARGLGGALHVLQQQSYGPWILGAVSFGFIAFGAYLLALARYRRFE
jgi:hypothetical protein